MQQIQNKLFESLIWTRTKIINELKDPALLVIVDKIENGYNYAITREMLFARAFVEKFSPITNSQMDNSSVRFLLELLLQARKDDLQKMISYKNEYIQSTNQLISKNFFIRQVVVAAEIQVCTAQALCELLSNHSSQMNYKTKHEQLTRELKYELEQFINSYSTSSNFDIQEANGFLKRLDETKITSPEVDQLTSIENNEYKNLENRCNQILQLGNSYASNGRILDISLGAARDFAKQFQLPLTRVIEQSERKPVETPIFPPLSKLTPAEYDKLIQEQGFCIQKLTSY